MLKHEFLEPAFPPKKQSSWLAAHWPELLGAFVAFSAVFLFVLIPSLVDSDHDRGWAASAISSLRTLNESQSIYLERSTGNVYGTLKDLNEANLIDEVLSSGKRQGYRFTCTPDPVNPEYLYTITATPVLPGQTGDVWFYTDQSGVIRYSKDGPANEKSPALGQR